jgi:1,2-phenylacetyl-CoA epoxidase catalytic subunit
MLKEEAFHIGTGQTGLGRIIRGGRVATPLLQKYLNKWIPTAYDLFGVDHSSSAHWFYVWGLKGRFDEHRWEGDLDRSAINEHSRGLYYEEVKTLIEQLNRHVPEGQPKLYAPDLKFHRSIGQWKGETFSAFGEKLDADAWTKHCAEALPTAADEAQLADVFKDSAWIAAKS